MVHDSTTGESTNARVDARNRLAAGRLEHANVLIDDQHALMLKHPELHSDDAHFGAPGIALQAVQVAEMVRMALGKRMK